ncbi:uncharacterized protein LOC135131604 [Zophobas morio]|uniref:uncharacterized protein LOC135131604 n=1 Tax=Zophobas morio TaxID=2755281 RepID=UPI003083B7A0
MSEKLQIFEQPRVDHSIIREEEHTYNPEARYLDVNDEIDIIINQEDLMIPLSECYLDIDGEFDHDDLLPNNIPPLNGNIYLTNNAGAFLFESITYELNNKEVDVVRDVGLLSTVKTFLCYGEDESNELGGAGWAVDDHGIKTFNVLDKTFSLRIPLSSLLNLPYDYHRVVTGKHKLRLVRSKSDDNCYVSTGTRRARINIKNIALIAKHVYPNDEMKIQMLNKINKSKAILIPFRKWEIHELPILPRSKNEVWKVKTLQSVHTPLYCIVFFQTNRKNNPLADATKFDNINIRSIRLHLNSNVYPYESWKLDFTKNRYREAYQAYCNFYKQFNDQDRAKPILKYDDFKRRSIFVLDCSKHPEPIRYATVDVSLDFESDNDFPENTKAYVIIIHDAIIEYIPMLKTTRELI